MLVATAPVRVADAGGWTDTWFAGQGLVCNVAVAPGACVRVRPADREDDRDGLTVVLTVGSTGERYALDPAAPPGRHPLLEQAIALDPPPHAVEIDVGAGVPPGSGTGTSAAVVVALLAALAALQDRRPPPGELAAAAHAVETGLGLQSGVQDQHAAANGGIQLLEVEYPAVRSTPITVPPGARAELDRRLVTVYLGRPHRSSALHEAVIARLEGGDPERALAPLRAAARAAADALTRGDLAAYGDALVANTRAQEDLHADLVGAAAHRAFRIARAHGASGWKVNGAGGDGGTVTILAGDDPAPLRAALAREPRWQVLDLVLGERGVQVRSE